MKNIFLVRHNGYIDYTYSVIPEAPKKIKPGKRNGPQGDWVMTPGEADRCNSLLSMIGPTIELIEAHVKVSALDVAIVAGPFICESVPGDLPHNPLMTASQYTTPKGMVKWSNARSTHIDAGGNDLGGSVAGALAKMLSVDATL